MALAASAAEMLPLKLFGAISSLNLYLIQTKDLRIIHDLLLREMRTTHYIEVDTIKRLFAMTPSMSAACAR
jgi:hypothetical protein